MVTSYHIQFASHGSQPLEGWEDLACQQEAGEDWEVDWEIAQEVKDWENEMEYCWMAGN